jgi:hypothetical protein
MLVTRREAIVGGLGVALAGMLPLEALAADGKAPVVNRIMLKDGRVWIAAKIGDKGPFLFVIDTGGYVSFIDNGFAKKERMPTVKGQTVSGIGGVSDLPWYNAGTVTLESGIRFPDMLFAGLRGPPSRDAVGTLGAGLFTTYDSDLDFVKGEWRAYTDGRPSFDGLTRLDSRFTRYGGGSSIVADAAIDGFTGSFVLDTGAPGEVHLDGRAAAKSGLWDDSKPYAPMRASGVGNGKSEARLVRAGRLTIGPFVFERPLVMIEKPGSFSSDRRDGLIGLTVLGQLNLTTQVSKQVLWASSNGLPVGKRGYPLSGLWLDAAKGGVVVADVGTGSPAAAAGLKIGDMVVGELPALIRTISGPPGKQVVLTVDRGGAKREVSYALAEWF